MISLILCSLTFSDEVTYIKKQLNDSTTVLKLTIPDDNEVYTCFDTGTYANTISKLGACKFEIEKLSLCQDNITSYNIIDSLYYDNISHCREILKDTKKFNDELFNELLEEKEHKWYWIMGAFAAGTIIGSITINFSN